MGFINYHGKHEDRFEDVEEYAKLQEQMENCFKDEKIKRKWIAELLKNPVYESLEANDILKCVIRQFRDASDTYRALVYGISTELDTERLWKDFWFYITGEYLEVAGIFGEKKHQIVLAFCEKVWRFGNVEEAERHCFSYGTDRKYTRYIYQCFLIKEGEKTHFWRWIGVISEGKREVASRLLKHCGECICLLSYYFYLKVHPEMESWIYKLEQDKKLLEEMKNLYRFESMNVPVYRKMRNPLYQKMEAGLLKKGLFRRCLLLQKKKKRLDRDEEMIEELYDYLNDKGTFRQIEAILPEEIKAEINDGILPVFKEAAVSGLGITEVVHYIEHGRLYVGKDEEYETIFQEYKGTFVITDKGILFRGGTSLRISFEEILEFVRYDMEPEILEADTCNKKTYFLEIPDMTTAYKLLKTIVNKANGDVITEKTEGFSYEELVGKADINACIFVFECIEAYWLPEDLKQKISLLLRKMRGMKKAIEDYPERKDEITRFLNYYIPEAAGILNAYCNYQQAELEQKTMEKLYEKVTESIETLDAAVEKKILNIYRMETMNTTAKANALKQILEQDGYSRDKRILKL